MDVIILFFIHIDRVPFKSRCFTCKVPKEVYFIFYSSCDCKCNCQSNHYKSERKLRFIKYRRILQPTNSSEQSDALLDDFEIVLNILPE